MILVVIRLYLLLVGEVEPGQILQRPLYIGSRGPSRQRTSGKRTGQFLACGLLVACCELYLTKNPFPPFVSFDSSNFHAFYKIHQVIHK